MCREKNVLVLIFFKDSFSIMIFIQKFWAISIYYLVIQKIIIIEACQKFKYVFILA